MEILFIFFIPFMVVLFFQQRSEYVLKCRMHALDRVDYYVHEAIHRNAFQVKPDLFWKVFHSYGTYNGMVFNLRAWRYEAFFPDIEKRMQTILDRVPELTQQEMVERHAQMIRDLGYVVTIDKGDGT
jgi:hypothetical protein